MRALPKTLLRRNDNAPLSLRLIYVTSGRSTRSRNVDVWSRPVGQSLERLSSEFRSGGMRRGQRSRRRRQWDIMVAERQARVWHLCIGLLAKAKAKAKCRKRQFLPHESDHRTKRPPRYLDSYVPLQNDNGLSLFLCFRVVLCKFSSHICCC